MLLHPANASSSTMSVLWVNLGPRGEAHVVEPGKVTDATVQLLFLLFTCEQNFLENTMDVVENYR
jgi:hypothetical protein